MEEASSVREAEQVLAVAVESGARAHDVTAHAILASIARAQGQSPEAATHLEAGRDAQAHGRHLFGADLLAWTSARLAADRGHIDVALAELGGIWQATRSLRGLTQFRAIAPDLVRWAVAEGRDSLTAGGYL